MNGQRLLKLACLVGLVTFIAVASSLDLADDLAWSGDGPGLTFDEDLNMIGGVYYLESAIATGLGVLHPAIWSEIFNSPSYHPDYPPLGRLPSAFANAVMTRLPGHPEDIIYRVSYGRVGTAVVFATLVSLVFAYTARRTSWLGGLVAAASLVLTPRVFGHAHLASVETMMNLTYTGCVLATCRLIAKKQTLNWTAGIVPGVLLGLALLTKIQAIFLPPVMVVWLLAYWKKNSIPTILALAFTSFVVFMIGWPWLWADPVGRFVSYFSQGSGRAAINCFYMGQVYPDHAVPWHYPWVMVLSTTPIANLVLVSLGVAALAGSRTTKVSTSGQLQSSREDTLILGAILFPLIVFSLPSVAVYDGERLFLIVWPLMSVFCGIGADWLKQRQWAQRVVAKQALVATGLLVATTGLWNLSKNHPNELASYCALIGGSTGANRLGLETTYWGDSLSAAFLKSSSQLIPEGSTVGIAPVLHPAYLQGMQQQSWLRHRPDLKIIAYDDNAAFVPEYVYFVRRHADPWRSLLEPPTGSTTVAQALSGSVPVADLLKRPTVNDTPKP